MSSSRSTPTAGTRRLERACACSANRRGGDLCGGQQERAFGPKLRVLDEPTEGPRQSRGVEVEAAGAQ